MRFLDRLIGPRRTQRSPSTRAHVTLEAWPQAIYAIGDIHGCADELLALRLKIDADARQYAGEKWLVYLGDYVDRGPSAAQVLDQLTAPAAEGWRALPLAGNHEVMMLDFFADPRRDHGWLRLGGVETLMSYGIDTRALMALNARQRIARLQACVPEEHLSFLRALPLTLSVPGAVFVHAGLRPGIALEEQTEDDLLWIRGAFLDGPAPDRLIVHGHTPAPDPVVAPGRICIDTGAYVTGKLTAIRLTEFGEPYFLQATSTAKVTQ